MDSKAYAVQLHFKDDPELYQALTEYKNSKGWTWKRMMLVGVAEAMAKDGENPDLILRIVDYLQGKR